MYIGNNLTSLLLRITFEDMEVCEAVKTFFCKNADIATKMVKIANVDNNLIGNGQNGLAFKLLVDFYIASKNNNTFNSFKTKIAERKNIIKENMNSSSPAIKAPEQHRPLESRGSSSNSSYSNIENLENQKLLQNHGLSKGLLGRISIGGKKKTRKVKKSKNKKKSRKAVKKNKKRTLKKRTLKKRR